MNFKIWFKETRPQYLVLSLALVLLGTCIAYNDGYFHWLKCLLTAAGLLLAHASVNVLNDYFDYKSGLDAQTTQTPFVSGWGLLILVLIGGVVIYSYTSFLTKWLMGELWAGLGLGILPVIGTYFIQTGVITSDIILVSLIPGFLTANLLLLNEFPDYEADKKVGRFNLVIALGKKNASILYFSIVFVVYIFIAGCIIWDIMPKQTILALITIIFAIQAVIVIFKNYNKNVEAILPALKYNVITILGIDFLLSLGYLLS